MRRLLLTLAFGAVMATGCNDNKNTTTAEVAEAGISSQAAASAQAAVDRASAAASAQAAQVSEQHKAAQAELQKSLDAVDRKLTYLKDRAAKLTGAKKADVLRAQTDTESKRAALTSDMSQLAASSGASWDSAQSAVSRDMTGLTTSMDRFETMVTGQPAH